MTVVLSATFTLEGAAALAVSAGGKRMKIRSRSYGVLDQRAPVASLNGSGLL